ncbi:MAG TPA: RimK family alpha-L-glutamate ligase [Gaiellaceae bacterium]|nr:RimK family alpha-L-glutamate ligase [Gaiellaceae bacterium]
MSRVGVIGYAQPANVDLVAAWKAAGIDAALVAPQDAVAELSAGDVAIGRLDVLQTLDGVEPGLEELDHLEARGVIVLNGSAALLTAHDKLLSDGCLARAGVRRPPAAHVSTADDLRRLPLPFVVKPRFGSWGRDVFRCRSRDELEACLAVIAHRRWFSKDGAIAQELVPSPGFDLRVIVAGGTVVGAAERVARPGEWRTNISLGGTLRPAHLPEEARQLAIRSAAALDADLIGVDLLPVPDGYTVIEMNGAVEFDARYSLPGTVVYTAVANALSLAPADAVTLG